LAEVKSLNCRCYFSPLQRANQKCLSLIWTIDREASYVLDKPHKAISRVFQSFEMVHLAYLVACLLEKGVISVSLDHEFMLVYEFKFYTRKKEFLQEIENEFQKCPYFLLRGHVPLEYYHTKRRASRILNVLKVKGVIQSWIPLLRPRRLVKSFKVLSRSN
jgi:hypothetical protein